MTPDYEEIQDILSNVQSPYTAEDCHGMLCAMLVVNNSLQCKRWMDEICTQNEEGSPLEGVQHDALCALFEHTKQELNDTLLNFTLLIPEDSNSLNSRVTSLKKWCDGFLFGLALAGVKDLKHVPEDSMEILQDITTISQASEDEDEEDEMNEVAYMDIVEYIRMGVLLINEEMQPINRHQTIQ
jgi:yecA family protein